jgi:tRNA dimethylallyltransferase
MTDSILPKVQIITGPTASGKSAYAIGLAEAMDGVIINADSMQVYRDLPILTAQPNNAERECVPHRLYGVLDGGELCTAARWLDMAKQEIIHTWQAGKLPILVGGTGLYLKSLIRGIADIPDIPDEIRQEMRERLRRYGNTEFHTWLSARDPVMAGRLAKGDTQRMLRAAEVVVATGQSLAEWQQKPLRNPIPQAEYTIKALNVPRDMLYHRINQRFENMIEAGALQEVKQLSARNLPHELPIMRAHGVPELIRYLQGEMSLDEAIIKGQQNTRNYAKRQFTWLKHQFPETEWIEGVTGG